jgi:hypothetical protein
MAEEVSRVGMSCGGWWSWVKRHPHGQGPRRCGGQAFGHGEQRCRGLHGNKARRLGQARLQPGGPVSRLKQNSAHGLIYIKNLSQFQIFYNLQTYSNSTQIRTLNDFYSQIKIRVHFIRR